MAKILLLNGPNLNLLGKREPEIYGSRTLNDVFEKLNTKSKQLGHILEHFQTNAEHELINKIHESLFNQSDFIIINPGGLTHTSICLRDALLSTKIPFIEIHISNIFSREKFRQKSFLSDIAVGVISGLGIKGYELALEATDHYLKNH